MRTFFDLPLPILLNFLNFKEHGQVAAVSKALKNSCDDNNQWNSLLKPEFQNYTVTGIAKLIFLTDPDARAKYIYFDEAGKAYLNLLIKNKIAAGGLTDVQIAHLRSPLVKKQIADGMLDIDKAILRSAPTEVAGLNPTQIEGIKAGLSCEQVNHPWYNFFHTQAIYAGIPYETIAGLSVEQIDGIRRAGLSREQVDHSWYTATHTEAIKAGISYEAIVGLSDEQVDGMHRAGLTREQVNFPWYSEFHTNAIKDGIPYTSLVGVSEVQLKDIHDGGERIDYDVHCPSYDNPYTSYRRKVAAKAGVPYESIANLSSEKIFGIQAGLTPEQVNHAWYSKYHTKAIEAGIPYEAIAGLNDLQVWEMLVFAHSTPTPR